MLKIKDGVDLKELEKFGFSYDAPGICYTYEIYNDKMGGIVFIHIGCETKTIEICFGYDFGVLDSNIDVIYELIQAGLVEKVM